MRFIDRQEPGREIGRICPDASIGESCSSRRRGQNRAIRGIITIIIGLIFIIGGLTGRLVLIGTHNGPALSVVGVALLLLGIFRVAKRA